VTQFDNTSRRWFVAIDGGGSKIAGAISNQGHDPRCDPQSVAVIRHIAEGTGSAAISTWDIVRTNLIRMFERLLNKVSIGPENILNVVLMLAGASRRDDVARVTESLTSELPFSSCNRLTVTSDIQPLLYEARDADPGLPSIVVIAGTGSLVVSLDSKDNVVRAGGWGPVLGDEGSGWGLSHAFLKTFCNWIDNNRDAGSTPEGLQVLSDFLAKKHLPTDPIKLNSAIITLASDRHVSARLAPSILDLAAQPSMTATFQSAYAVLRTGLGKMLDLRPEIQGTVQLQKTPTRERRPSLT